MGLISDYLEQCRERNETGFLDPCMIISKKPKIKYSYHYEIRKILTEYSNTNNETQKRLLQQQLIEQSSELETIKSGYLLGEKIILSVWNLRKLQSPLIRDTIQLLLSELRKYYHAICDLRQKINHQLDPSTIIYFDPPLESEIRKNMLKMIGATIGAYLQDSSMFLDTSEFRKVICDFAEIIRCLENEQYNQPNKKVVRYHLEKDFQIKISHLKCVNCGNFLLEDIPYCFNCYERN